MEFNIPFQNEQMYTMRKDVFLNTQRSFINSFISVLFVVYERAASFTQVYVRQRPLVWAGLNRDLLSSATEIWLVGSSAQLRRRRMPTTMTLRAVPESSSQNK